MKKADKASMSSTRSKPRMNCPGSCSVAEGFSSKNCFTVSAQDDGDNMATYRTRVCARVFAYTITLMQTTYADNIWYAL